MKNNIVEGWISFEEMNLVSKYMTTDTGSILEVGSANGRLISYLYEKHPDWEYVAVDPWEQEQVRLQVDWDADYFAPGNLKEVITMEMFKKHCPYAHAYNVYFEDFKNDIKFDIISMGLVGKKVNWELVYQKAWAMLKPGGYIIGRNITHKKYGESIRHAISSKCIIETCKGSFVIG